MGTINAANTLTFNNTDNLFARIRKRLNSFDAVGIIDEGDFYYYIKEIVERLGVSVYEEIPVVLSIDNYKAKLPDNFSYLYAAYKCDNQTNKDTERVHPQEGFVYYLEETRQPYKKCTNCHAAKINYVDGERVVLRTYVKDVAHTMQFNSPTLLRLGSNSKHMCDVKSPNLFVTNHNEITLDKGFLYTSFASGVVFMKYYGMPLDPESGLPMIPSSTFIEKAIEDYIVYRIIEDAWFNGSIPDMDKRYQVAKINSDDSMKSALYYCKLPSFQTAINYIRLTRNNLDIYQQTNF